MERTKRIKVVTGLKCNIQCIFCYYRDSLKAPNRPFEEVRKDLLYARRHGISEVDFSGGEPTIHPDLPRMISEARSIGMEKVCIITNGLRLSHLPYLKQLKDAGLSEILFSVHGSHEKIHDEITDMKGSFKKITEALSNSASEGLNIRMNTVVNRLNYNGLNAIGSFILQFHPIQVNFITINDWCFARHLVDRLMVRYSDMSYRLKEACDLLDRFVRAVNVRYIPFCFMVDYERFICNHRQVEFDTFEWLPRVRVRLEIQYNFFRYMGILGYGFLSGGVFKNIFRITMNDMLNESIVQALRHWNYTKHPNCRQCRFDEICDGVENTYAKQYGLQELTPVYGEKIHDPVFFRKQV